MDPAFVDPNMGEVPDVSGSVFGKLEYIVLPFTEPPSGLVNAAPYESGLLPIMLLLLLMPFEVESGAEIGIP